MRPIPNLQGYFADDKGGIWSDKPGRFNRWKTRHPIKPWRDRRGYMQVTLRPAGRRRRFTVHGLVTAAFLGDRPADLVVCHVNGNPSDNRLVNLRYATQLENIHHKELHGTQARGDNDPKAKVTDEQCREILRRIAAGETQRSLAACYGVSEPHISALKKGRIRRHLVREKGKP